MVFVRVRWFEAAYRLVFCEHVEKNISTLKGYVSYMNNRDAQREGHALLSLYFC
jgi:hypothetical protein